MNKSREKLRHIKNIIYILAEQKKLMTIYSMKTHSVLTTIMCLTLASCKIVKIEADMLMSKTQSIEPSDDACY